MRATNKMLEVGTFGMSAQKSRRWQGLCRQFCS